ncbi:hypothetical protein UPYG_G00245910 [Umbra pygmaea]|uniref:Transmembrane protein 179B n=1 Tax=Umbra pygmaea TaxID=75934 RepID=A0ABD0X0H4_UMBPY
MLEPALLICESAPNVHLKEPALRADSFANDPLLVSDRRRDLIVRTCEPGTMTPKIPFLLLLEIGVYVSSFVCGIVTAASLTITQGNFGGLCVLYGTVSYNSPTESISVTGSSAPSLCTFVLAISVSVAIYCILATFYWIYTSCLGEVNSRERVSMNLTLGLSGVFQFLLLVTGCVVTIGQGSLCDSVTDVVPKVTSCKEAENRTWDKPITGTQFYTGLHTAGTAVWVNFFFWMLICVLVLIQRGPSSSHTVKGSRTRHRPSRIRNR